MVGMMTMTIRQGMLPPSRMEARLESSPAHSNLVRTESLVSDALSFYSLDGDRYKDNYENCIIDKMIRR